MQSDGSNAGPIIFRDGAPSDDHNYASGEGVTEGSVARCSHVNFATKAKEYCTTSVVEVEHDALPLAEHSENRTLQGVRGQVVICEVGVAHDDADAR